MASLRTGDPLDKSTDVGAIVHPRAACADQCDLVAQGLSGDAVLHQARRAREGCFYPPTLVTGVSPPNILSQEEIFGPVATRHRLPHARPRRWSSPTTPATGWPRRSGRRTSNLCLDVAAEGEAAGVVWVNCTNVFDAGAGFGGIPRKRLRPRGRARGDGGLPARPAPSPKIRWRGRAPCPLAEPGHGKGAERQIDRTAKLYIGGKQARPDGGYAYAVPGAKGAHRASPGSGNRKDIRNAVEAAHKAGGWSGATGHNRAQVLYYLAENLDARAAEFAARLRDLGATQKAAEAEVATAVRRIFWYAAQADKFDGAVHATKSAHVTLAMPEPLG